jgi:hypothetical protein
MIPFQNSIPSGTFSSVTQGLILIGILTSIHEIFLKEKQEAFLLSKRRISLRDLFYWKNKV